MYSQKTLKKKITTSFPIGKKCGARTHDMKEEDIVKEFEPAALSPLNKKRKTVMNKLVEGIGP